MLPLLLLTLAISDSVTPVIQEQILLCRAHFSVGEIDGTAGTNFKQAVLGFQKAHGIRATGVMDPATKKALIVDPGPALVKYRITADDVAGPFVKIPDDWAEMAKLPKMGFESVDAELGERFHANPALLRKLNPGKTFDQADTEILVPNVAIAIKGKVASVVVSKSKGTVTAFDLRGKLIAQFPSTTGSTHDPLPIGDWKIMNIAFNPTFIYNPDLFWDAEGTSEKEKIAAGPRGPVGVVWIGISKPHYGIHGTAIPSEIGHTQSHGCIRLTNWDAMELAKAVGPGTLVHLKE